MLELGTASNAGEELIRDVSEATFMADVIEASKTTPVIVDFWAPWCGPCKTLGPALEAAVLEAGGRVKMAKVNVDENQTIAGQMRVQSIPAVFAFVDGQPVDGFMGAKPASEIKAFIDKIAGPADNGLNDAIDAAEQMLQEGAAVDAAQTFAAVLGEEPANAAALAGLARAHLALGEAEKALALLKSAPDEIAGDPALTAAMAQAELALAAAEAGDISGLQAAVEANPDDLQARLDLATALMGRNDAQGAIDILLEVFRRDREWNDAAAKTQLFRIFDSLGPTDPVAQAGRRRLSSMIFA
jgi:putative thioredoxin